MEKTNQALYTLPFLLLCISFAFFGGSFNMIIPELPAFLSELGGADYKGLIIALFTLTAGISRPFSGKLADTIGRVPVIIVGAIVCIVCSLLYPILSTISGFLLLRLCHGFSTGFTPTAITAYVADIVPEHRRGEGMGIMGVSLNLGSSISPPIGSYLANTYSLDVMFYASSASALISLLILTRMKETLRTKQSFHPSLLKLTRNEVIDKDAILPAIICGLSYIGFGALVTITPDQCEFLGISNKGLFFTSFTVCSILSRLVAGTISDKYGRIIVIKVAIICLCISHIMLGLSNSPTWLLTATGFLGFSLGIGIPALFAWTIDRSQDSKRGQAMATIYIGLEVAIGSGALLGAALYDNNASNFGKAFYVMAFITGLGLLFLRKEKVEISK